MPGSQATDRRGAGWSAPDSVFADLFPAAEPPGLFDTEVCTCPACNGNDESMSLPVLRPRPDEELAATAAASALVERACALARWLGAGRRLTPSKVLRPVDAVAAVAELGLDRPVLPADDAVEAPDPRPFGRGAGSMGPRARSAKHLPALQPIWAGAVRAGLIELRGQKAVPGPALGLWPEPAPTGPVADTPDPRRRLDCWARLVAGYLRAQAEIERTDELWFSGPPQLLLPTSALLLYSADDTPLTPATLVMGAQFAVRDDGEPDLMLLLTIPEQVARWTEVLDTWAMVGAVTPAEGALTADGRETDGVAPSVIAELAEELEPLIEESRRVFPAQVRLLEPLVDSLRKGPLITVSPCGRELLARVLRGQGFTVPTVGDLADTPPGDLLLALSGHDPAAAAEEIRIWLDARGQGWSAAVHDLVTSASGKDDEGPLRRAALPVVVALVAETAGSMIPQWQEDPWLAVPIAIGLAAASRAPQPQPAHLLWMAVDVLSAELDDDDAFADLAEVTGVAELLAPPGAVAEAVGLDHPHTREVLRVLAKRLEDRALARRLRQALAKDRPGRRTPKGRRPPTPPPRGL